MASIVLIGIGTLLGITQIITIGAAIGYVVSGVNLIQLIQDFSLEELSNVIMDTLTRYLGSIDEAQAFVVSIIDWINNTFDMLG